VNGTDVRSNYLLQVAQRNTCKFLNKSADSVNQCSNDEFSCCQNHDTTSGNPIFIRAFIQVIFRRYVLKKLDLTAHPSWLHDRKQQPHIWGLHVVCTIVQVRFRQICVCAVAVLFEHAVSHGVK